MLDAGVTDPGPLARLRSELEERLNRDGTVELPQDERSERRRRSSVDLKANLLVGEERVGYLSSSPATRETPGARHAVAGRPSCTANVSRETT